jgi:hypothetical protein
MNAKTIAALCGDTQATRARFPQQIINARRWILWAEVPNPDPTKKPRKVPYYVDGKPREDTDTPEDMARLATYDDALNAFVFGDRDYAGLGFALGPDGTGNHWQGFDADKLTAAEVDAYISNHDDLGYTEVSPSGKGVHVIGYGRDFQTLGSNGTGVEAYAHGRYFTFTSERGRGQPTCIAAFVEGPVAQRHRKTQTGAAGETFGIDAKTITELRSALLHMRSDDYDIWYRMGLALRELGEIGRGLWLEWSATSTKFNVQEASKKWEQLGTPRDTGYQAVFAEAQRRGWVNPASNAAQFQQPVSSGGFTFGYAKPGEALVETDYLIDPWTPRATLIGYYGRGEAGKSSWAGQLCAAVSNRVTTLWVSSEEKPSHIRQRHLSCGGEADTLAVVETVPTKFDPVTKKVTATSFNIFDHLEPAIEAFKANAETRKDRPLGVVVLDAVVALVTWGKGENANDDAAVKRLCTHLQGICERQNVTIKMLGHLNKGTHKENIADAVTGAAAWTNSPRLSFMFVKDIESENFEGFVRTAKSNTGTHFGATYKTVPRHILRTRPDGKNDVLCGVNLVTDVVWGEMDLREMMAGEQGDEVVTRVQQKRQRVAALVDVVLSQIKANGATNRKAVEIAIPNEKFQPRHWTKAEQVLAKDHGVQVDSTGHNVYVYTMKR